MKESKTMIDCNEFGFIKDKIFGLTGFDFVGEITVKSFDGVKVDFDGKNAVIGCKDKTTLARGLFQNLIPMQFRSCFLKCSP